MTSTRGNLLIPTILTIILISLSHSTLLAGGKIPLSEVEKYDAEKCYEAGATGYITKPYEPKRILEKVKSILG